ncbi:MAG: hypothetical protein ABI626_06315 [Sphingomicrobium sp.]
MLSLVLSRAASGLLRALLQRSGDQCDRILLSEVLSVAWQSLTFVGERHRLRLRIRGPGARQLVGRLIDGLEEAEFAIPGQIVADIALAGAPARDHDGSFGLEIEALTVAE